MKTFAAFLIFVAGILAAIQWSQIAYRLYLFVHHYHGERGVNHIGEAFADIYLINALLLAMAISGLMVLWRHSRTWRTAAAVIGATNLLGWIALFVMHQTGVLVEYGEFIRHMRGEA